MLVIHSLLVMFMTIDTLKGFVVVRIDVAGGAVLPLALMRVGINRKVLRIMIEGRGRPGGHRVAGCAILRKIQCDMIRVGWPLEIILMTGKAILRRAGVHIVDVTLGARHGLVRAKQWKS